MATPIEQQMSGVEGMDYMYSINANNGMMTAQRHFRYVDRGDDGSDPRADASDAGFCPVAAGRAQFRRHGRSVRLVAAGSVRSLFSPKGQLRSDLSRRTTAYININDPMTRVPGMGSVSIFGAGQYAMRIWVQPDRLATLNITVPEVIRAVQAQNNVNPAGQIGGEPVPQGRSLPFTVNTTGPACDRSRTSRTSSSARIPMARSSA